MIQRLRCSDCGDVSPLGTAHDCWVRLKLTEQPIPLDLICPRCSQPTYGLFHWRCEERAENHGD